MPVDLGPKLIHARHGDLWCYPTDVYLGAAVCKFGEYSELEYQFLRDAMDLMGPPGTIVEVGANAGYLSIPLRKHCRVLDLYEPQASVRTLLKDNFKLNPAGGMWGEESWVRFFDQAVGSQAGEIDCPVVPYSMPVNHGGVPMGKNTGSPIKEYVKVPMVRLDDQGHDNVKLIKVDVEGMEEQVLKGARQLIACDQPILYVENDRLDQSQSLIELVWKMGYWCAFHLPPLYNPDNFFHNPENPWGNVVSINMVCVPKGKRLPPGVAIKHGLKLVEDSKQHPMRQA